MYGFCLSYDSWGMVGVFLGYGYGYKHRPWARMVTVYRTHLQRALLYSTLFAFSPSFPSQARYSLIVVFFPTNVWCLTCRKASKYQHASYIASYSFCHLYNTYIYIQAMKYLHKSCFPGSLDSQRSTNCKRVTASAAQRWQWDPAAGFTCPEHDGTGIALQLRKNKLSIRSNFVSIPN